MKKQQKVNCITLILLAFGFFIFCAGDANAAEPKKPDFVIKLGHCDTHIGIVESPYFTYTEVFKSIVEGRTDGRVSVRIFPNSQLGDLRSQMEQTSRGEMQMLAGMTVDLLASYDPNVQVLGIPYSFQNIEIGRKVLNGSFGQEITQLVREKSKLRVLSWLPTAFRNFSNSVREIRTPDDMKGLKMRVMQSPVHLSMVKALGANPTPIPWEELYSALQTGVADGQENPPYSVVMAKLYEVQKFYTLDNHLLNIAVVVMNDNFYNKLKPEDQKIIQYAARQAELSLLGVVCAKENQDLKKISDGGVKIYNPTPAEFAMFQKRAQGPVIEALEGKVSKVWVDKLFNAIKQAEKETGLLD
ncbi:MAG: DctP family TRAP transporter solute-binding subunit [Deltaproteobacteria bacterium]|nr:DctP family TRAP transporter solute-binding subunit [Deltaproteobacteria bacterium]